MLLMQNKMKEIARSWRSSDRIGSSIKLRQTSSFISHVGLYSIIFDVSRVNNIYIQANIYVFNISSCIVLIPHIPPPAYSGIMLPAIK